MADSDQPPLSKPQPLLVFFKDPQPRREFLANTRKLSKSDFKHISICPDLTKNHRKEDKQLRDKAIQLNLESPSDEKGPFFVEVNGCSRPVQWEEGQYIQNQSKHSTLSIIYTNAQGAQSIVN